MREQAMSASSWYINSPGDRRDVRVVVNNYSTVSVDFRSYTVVYRQVGPQNSATCTFPPNSPICSLGGGQGQRYYWTPSRLEGVTTSGAPYARTTRTYPLRIITADLLTYIDAADPSDITAGGIDCYVTLLGTDENDHDVKATGTFHIEVF